jgi:putative spermidine/putrescine transport system substrate-binding protein/spermidine/putrescine transport system substrate-binding protein
MNAQFDVALAVAAVIGGFADLLKPTPAEMEQLPDLWTRLVAQSRLLWNDRAEAEQAFASGEAVIGFLWSDSVRTLRSQGIPIAIAPPLLTWVCGYALNADAPGSEEQAYDFLNALLDPMGGKVLIEWATATPTANPSPSPTHRSSRNWGSTTSMPFSPKAASSMKSTSPTATR